MPERENHIEEVLVLEDLAEPAFVLDFDGVSEVSEVVENTGIISRLAHDIEIFGRARHAGIGAERIRACQQERKVELRELAQGLGVKSLGAGRWHGRLGGCIDRHYRPCDRSDFLRHEGSLEAHRP